MLFRSPRSGLAASHQIIVLGGVIDHDYRGEVIVMLHNLGRRELILMSGERVAQLILEKNHIAPVLELTELNTTDTARGVDGFGSTERREVAQPTDLSCMKPNPNIDEHF